ncbi:hypothetical protein DOTSEDRAFT_32609 [Dothistroma septosporum NZE10]|uniref:Ecp2 effector protein domain-containing protein n=1 Tax=Dothistroma septosporum (strain NZE10 / CBS 128990) TaxID=675120 RepID=N1PU67_DOTSN|nr:hypothetical protein DOTSEDRAFT_32609 [Dothistroma septosporum NZE10]
MHAFQILAVLTVGAGAVAINNGPVGAWEVANNVASVGTSIASTDKASTFHALRDRIGGLVWRDPYTWDQIPMNCTRRGLCCQTDPRNAILMSDPTTGSELCERTGGKKHHQYDDKRMGNHTVTYIGPHGKSPMKLSAKVCTGAMQDLREECPTNFTVGGFRMTFGGVLFKDDWVYSVNMPTDGKTVT